MPNPSYDIVIDCSLPKCAENALSELFCVLSQRGIEAPRVLKPSETTRASWILGITGQSYLVNQWASRQQLELPQAAESLMVKKLAGESVPSVVVCGADARGLTYALLEIAQAIKFAPTEMNPYDVVEDESSSPRLAVRSMAMFLFNAQLEKDWFYDQRFWDRYFQMLATYRYNGFSLICGHHTTHMSPPFPYSVAVKDFPEVRVRGLTSSQRSQNLQALRMASQTAADWGIDFTLGVWEQIPIHKHGTDDLQIECLTTDIVRDYCALGLKSLLQECPAIKAVQLRLNHEGGIGADDQPSHFAAQFQAIKNCGRPVGVDLRYKGLQKQTIQAAVDLGLATSVSTKYWCEHLGLPYHPTVVEKAHRPSRYSYGDLISDPKRSYRVIYHLWSAGSQRVLLWGDPQYVRRFARSCHLGGGAGFEVMAPLTNKGFGNQAEDWRIFQDRSLENYEHEYERYWMFYLLFGRLGYDDKANEKIWQREIQHRFGREAAATVDEAYATSGQIIPFLTVVRSEAASIWKYWPELSAGPSIADYGFLQPTDTAQFYAIESFQWRNTMDRRRWEPRDMEISGFVEDSLRGRLAGKWTPPMISRHLHQLANRTLAQLEKLRKTVSSETAETRAMMLDFHITALLARYHAEKITAAMHLAFHQRKGVPWRIHEALSCAYRALDAWRSIVALTLVTYHSRLEFGDKQGAGIKHWLDQLPVAEKDVEYLQGLIRQHLVSKERELHLGESPEIKHFHVEHDQAKCAIVGEPLSLSIRLKPSSSISQLKAHYRGLDQCANWENVVLRRGDDQSYSGHLPADAGSSGGYLMYYFEWQLDDGTAANWPSWVERDPYFVLPIQTST